MSQDFFASYPATSVEELQALVKCPAVSYAPAFAALMAQTAVAQETKLAGLTIYRELIRDPRYREALASNRQLLDLLALGPPEVPRWNGLPEFSFFLRLDFRLAMPYLGRDDCAFSVTENPVRKDRVFGLPFISATTWKGALRHACSLRSRAATNRIFGPARGDDSEEDAFRGRLFTYPSYFTQIGLEMINPHDRAARTGKNPIQIECVPCGADSRLAMLYAPITDSANGEVPEDVRHQVRADLPAVATACVNCLLKFGFSAKRSSGYGTVDPKLTGKLGLLKVLAPISLERTFSDLKELPRLAVELAEEIEKLA